MKTICLTVNGRRLTAAVEPRTHLADFLREKLLLTGTHLRCEQGVCGACTLLIDGQPARSCITYAVGCDGAEITTIEGLDDDPTADALRRAFAAEHGLQCGYCTPAMVITARDIVSRLPDADEARVRTELSGNLCRCTGYVGIVRAVRRVLEERKSGALDMPPLPMRAQLGPVGSSRAAPLTTDTDRPTETPVPTTGADVGAVTPAPGEATPLGLGSRQPNIEIDQSFTVNRPPAGVWAFLGDIERVVPCMPGAILTGPATTDRLTGRITVKLGPITASFAGEAQILRDEARQRGQVLGSGRDNLSGSRAAAEIDYLLIPEDGGSVTRVEITLRALLTGPLAQFSRSGIVDDLAARLTGMFARNLEQRLSGSGALGETGAAPQAVPIQAGSLLRAVIVARLKALLSRVFGKGH